MTKPSWHDRLLFGTWWRLADWQESPRSSKFPYAVLRPLASRASKGLMLDLYPTDDTWRALSSDGARTYGHSEGLMRGETWRFTTAEGVYEVRGCNYMPFAKVCQIFGAHEIARPDRDSVVLRLRKLRPFIDRRGEF